jgi:hypothetical protein
MDDMTSIFLKRLKKLIVMHYILIKTENICI